MIELAKCRCGGDAITGRFGDGFRVWVCCRDKCAASTPPMPSEAEAIAAWNRMQNPNDTFAAGVEACRELAEQMMTPKGENDRWSMVWDEAFTEFRHRAKELKG